MVLVIIATGLPEGHIIKILNKDVNFRTVLMASLDLADNVFMDVDNIGFYEGLPIRVRMRIIRAIMKILGEINGVYVIG